MKLISQASVKYWQARTWLAIGTVSMTIRSTVGRGTLDFLSLPMLQSLHLPRSETLSLAGTGLQQLPQLSGRSVQRTCVTLAERLTRVLLALLRS
jgi:hypothetical protein